MKKRKRSNDVICNEYSCIQKTIPQKITQNPKSESLLSESFATFDLFLGASALFTALRLRGTVDFVFANSSMFSAWTSSFMLRFRRSARGT